MNIHNARKYIGDRLIRTAKPHRILDPAQGPLIAVKLNILTRKTLGGFETDLDSRVFGSEGAIMPGLYAAGEAAGFGGGGMHGYRSLEGTFLGGCLFSGQECRQGGGEGCGIVSKDPEFSLRRKFLRYPDVHQVRVRFPADHLSSDKTQLGGWRRASAGPPGFHRATVPQKESRRWSQRSWQLPSRVCRRSLALPCRRNRSTGDRCHRVLQATK